MSAFPGVRKKRLLEAFENRELKGYAWNNLMLSSWTDHEGKDVQVRDAYLRNQTLIDLSAQPPEIIEKFDQAILASLNLPARSQVGVALMKFCANWGLVKIEKSAQDYSVCFRSGYQGHLKQNLIPTP
jgi:hypothetical protein